MSAAQACFMSAIPTSDAGPLEVLCEDGPVLAVNKPAGLLTQGVPIGIPTLEAQVKEYLKQRYAKPGNVYLGIPHRLDRPVSGVVVFARNSKAAARLAEQFRERQVRKVYWAVVEGRPEPDFAELTDWLRKVPEVARAEPATAKTPGARECRLAYRTLRPVTGGTLVEVELGTGRMHQIRAQLALHGWPVVGDREYGARTRLVSGEIADPRQEPIALHARSLTILHPVRYTPLTIEAPLPSSWESILTGADVREADKGFNAETQRRKDARGGV